MPRTPVTPRPPPQRYRLMRLRAVRLERGFTQLSLCVAANLSITSIQLIEGGHNTRPETSLRIAKVLGVTVRDLL